jgi:bleomycin hydrolase
MYRKFIAVALGLISIISVSAQERMKQIDDRMIDGFRREVKPVRNACYLSGDMLEVGLDRELVASYDTTCTYRVSYNKVTDQSKSGRCWLFSTLNILRDEMIKKYDMGNFEFSQTYGMFWDVLEKSNRFLENVIDNRKKPIDSRINDFLFKKPIGDGGHFANAAHIIDKYGLVPQEIMPEMYASLDNKWLMNTVRTALRRYGLKLRDADKKEIQSVKEKALLDIYNILTCNLGEPPTEFEWTLKDKDGKVISTKKYTPLSFRDEFVRHDLEKDYVIFMDDPTKPYYRMYSVCNSRNCYEYPDWTFLNVPAAELLEMGVESLKHDTMFYFSADTDASAVMIGGIYDVALYNFGGDFGADLSMTKEEMVRSCEIKSLHAIAMAGVKLGEDGKPVKWLVENSFGEIRGWDGYVVMQNKWLETYLFRLVVERRFVPEKLIRMLDQKPKVIPQWNPTY